MTGQMDLFAEATGQHSTKVRCDHCASWKRTLSNHWGECSALKAWKGEGESCHHFVAAPTPAKPVASYAELQAMVKAGCTDEQLYQARGYDAYGRPYP